jgi:hypothetical protein
MSSIPALEEFLDAPYTDLQPLAPQAVVYAAAGTRRSAELAGLSSTSDEYARWSRMRMIEALQVFFRHDVRHVFTIPATPGQFAEVGSYRHNLLRWIEWGVAGEEALADYSRLGWRVRLLQAGAPELKETQEKLTELTAHDRSNCAVRTLWYLVVADREELWRQMLSAAVAEGATTRAAAVRALYGEDVPDVDLFLGFGKPVISPDLLPPLLCSKVDCYWTQRPGYRLDDQEFRTILYDHAVLRCTWQADKTERAASALANRQAWEQGPTLGLGTRMGPYWYPTSHLSNPSLPLNETGP